MTIEKEKSTRVRLILAILIGLGSALLPGAVSAQAQTHVTTCGQTLDMAGEYVLMNDLNCTATGDFDGVRITASNVTFHLAGHTISSPVCDLSRNITGIFVVGGITNVRIDGGNVSGFNDGIQLSASNSTVKGMKVSGACASGIGVQGANNRVEKNTASGNVDGVLLVNAVNSFVRCNYLSGNTRGATLSGSTTSSVVEDNIISDNDAFGVAVVSGSGNIVRDNAVNDNQNGIYINSANNRVLDNIVSRSSDVGISVTNSGSPSIMRRNTVYRSGNVDMTDDSANCGGNIWRNNDFVTDLVAGVSDGGPGAGCIR